MPIIVGTAERGFRAHRQYRLHNWKKDAVESLSSGLC